MWVVPYGFLPLLLAEYYPSLEKSIGVDIQTTPFPTIRAIAQEQDKLQVRFEEADVLSGAFGYRDAFDTVVALHLLEHITATQMYQALSHLWRVTRQRLLVAVPYEEGVPEAIYGHQQCFTPQRLAQIGQWAYQHLEEVNTIRYETCVGGLMLIERAPSS